MTAKEKKAAYDREYRRKNRAKLKVKKAAYFKKTYDPAKAAIKRKKRMPYHVAYCQRPEYKEYKKEYDRKRRSSLYGEFADAHSVLVALQKEINRLQPDREERYRQSQRHQWSPLTHAKRRMKRANLNPDSI